jgi:hypothetical protein
MDSRAVKFRSQRQYDEAEKLHRETLRLREEILGKKHRDTLHSMHNLGFDLGNLDRYDEAE